MSDQEQTTSHYTSPFDTIRHTDEQLGEYWSARELARILGYTEYNKFKNAILRAEEACKESGQADSDHFAHMGEMITVGKGARRKVDDVRLSRYACYLLVQNADPTGKPIVALGQTYFNIQTRRQELADQFEALPEDQKRLYRRSEISIQNQQLAATAQQAGVITPNDFSIFQNHGYRGLYTLTEDQIHALKVSSRGSIFWIG